MEIRKSGFNPYDARYIQAVRAEIARSIKPNVFPEITEEVQLALSLIDLVELSPEARELLKKLRYGQDHEIEESAWLSLLVELKEKLIAKSTRKKGDPKLNLITLPVMRPPLQEILPGDKKAKKLKKPSPNTARLILSKMMLAWPAIFTKERLCDELELLGYHMIDTCKNFGVRILILSQHERLGQVKINRMFLIAKNERTPDGRLKDEVRGIYFPDRRLMVIGEEQIGVPERLTSIHEFAHAYDHAFSEKHRRMHFLSTQLWNLFSQTRTEAISAYATTKPAEYFAESVEAYFLPTKRPILQQYDPQMYEFLVNLFQFFQ